MVEWSEVFFLQYGNVVVVKEEHVYAKNIMAAVHLPEIRELCEGIMGEADQSGVGDSSRVDTGQVCPSVTAVLRDLHPWQQLVLCEIVTTDSQSLQAAQVEEVFTSATSLVVIATILW